MLAPIPAYTAAECPSHGDEVAMLRGQITLSSSGDCVDCAECQKRVRGYCRSLEHLASRCRDNCGTRRY